MVAVRFCRTFYIHELTNEVAKSLGWDTEFLLVGEECATLPCHVFNSGSGLFKKAYLNWWRGGRPRPLAGQVVCLHQSALRGWVDSQGRGWGACGPPL